MWWIEVDQYENNHPLCFPVRNRNRTREADLWEFTKVTPTTSMESRYSKFSSCGQRRLSLIRVFAGRTGQFVGFVTSRYFVNFRLSVLTQNYQKADPKEGDMPSIVMCMHQCHQVFFLLPIICDPIISIFRFERRATPVTRTYGKATPWSVSMASRCRAKPTSRPWDL